MNASPVVMEREAKVEVGGKSGGKVGRQGPEERVVIPAKWRIGQFVIIAVLAVLAAWFYKTGWQSARGETGAADSRSLVDLTGFAVLAGLVWLTTPTAAVIALTTFQEAVRRRWMTALLIFALVLLALSTFFTWMQAGEEQNFIRDFGLGFIIIITLLMAIFLGVALVPPEIERRTIFTILSKPVDRLEFLIGKFMGLALTLLVNTVLMGGMFLLSFALFKIRREGFGGAMNATDPLVHPGLMFDMANITKALILQYGQLLVLSAMALTMSLLISGITAIVFCFLAYFGGQMSSYWEHLQEHANGTHGAALAGPVQGMINMVHFILPRLDKFDVRTRLVQDVPVGLNYMWKAMGSGLIYVAVLLAIAYLVFSDREF